MAEESNNLVRAFMNMDDYDYFIIDTSAGISAQVLSFCRACHEMILVITPEPTSLTDAYSFLKVLRGKDKSLPSVKVVVNKVKNAGTAQAVYKKLRDTVKRFLSIKLMPLGIVAYDPKVRAAIISQTPFLLAFPNSMASRCVYSLAKKLVQNPSLSKELPMKVFWANCLDLCSDRDKLSFDLNTTYKPSTQEKIFGLAPATSMEHLTRAVTSVEGRITELSSEVTQMRALLLELINAKSPFSPVHKGVQSRRSLSNFEKRDARKSNPKDCVVVPLKAAKPSDSESLQAMEVQLPDTLDMQPPKSGKLFFDFETWLQAKSQSPS